MAAPVRATPLTRMLANERLATPGYKPMLSLPGKWGMLQTGNLDLKARPMVRNRDGSVSTVRSITVTANGRAYLLPSVVGNRVVSNQAAIQNWQRTGRHLGVFANEKAADRYAQALHNQQASFYGV